MAIVHLNNLRSFEATPGSVLMDAAAAAGLTLEHSHRTGRRGNCRAKVTNGSAAPLRASAGPSERDAQDGWVLTCAHAAATDLALDIEDLGALAGVAVKTLPNRGDALERIAPDVVRARLRLPPASAFAWRAGRAARRSARRLVALRRLRLRFAGHDRRRPPRLARPPLLSDAFVASNP